MLLLLGGAATTVGRVVRGRGRTAIALRVFPRNHARMRGEQGRPRRGRQCWCVEGNLLVF